VKTNDERDYFTGRLIHRRVPAPPPSLWIGVIHVVVLWILAAVALCVVGVMT
jgi:hypothetical protein